MTELALEPALCTGHSIVTRPTTPWTLCGISRPRTTRRSKKFFPNTRPTTSALVPYVSEYLGVGGRSSSSACSPASLAEPVASVFLHCVFCRVCVLLASIALSILQRGNPALQNHECTDLVCCLPNTTRRDAFAILGAEAVRAHVGVRQHWMVRCACVARTRVVPEPRCA